MRLRQARKIVLHGRWTHKKRTILAAFTRAWRRLRRNIKLDLDHARHPPAMAWICTIDETADS